ncbi:hypothetical protein OH492_28590 [Vibrio chagasii]|nr:hypothetical protein [Vibrio chagasii]
MVCGSDTGHVQPEEVKIAAYNLRNGILAPSEIFVTEMQIEPSALWLVLVSQAISTTR